MAVLPVAFTPVTSPMDGISVIDIAYSPQSQLGVFVAVGASSFGGPSSVAKVATSPDGATWTAQSTGSLGAGSSQWVAVCLAPTLGGNGRFLAVGYTGTGTGANSVWTSDDGGVTWTGRGNLLPQASSCAWSPTLGLFVISGVNSSSGHMVATSPDGITWTQRSTIWDNPSFGGPCLPICCSGSQGINWQVEWLSGLGLFVMTGTGPFPTAGIGGFCQGLQFLAYSPDGITWTNGSSPYDGIAQACQISDWSTTQGRAICATSGVTHGWSQTTDGMNWTPLSDGPTNGNAFGHMKVAEGINGSIFMLAGPGSVNGIGQLWNPSGITFTTMNNLYSQATCFAKDLDMVVVVGFQDSATHSIWRSVPEAVSAAGAGACTTATLTGHLRPHTFDSNLLWYFEWGPTTAYGSISPLASIGGLDDYTVTYLIGGGLAGGSTYHCRITVVDTLGVAHHSSDSSWVQGACVDFPTVGGTFDI